MFKFLLIAALVPALVLAQTPVRQCPNGAALPQSVDINGCTSSPCQLVNGAPLQAVGMGITSPVASNDMKAHIAIRLAGLQIPFPMPDGLEDACATGVPAGTCPVSAGQTFDYTLNHAGQALSLTGVTVAIEVGLTADNGTPITCLIFDATIVN